MIARFRLPARLQQLPFGFLTRLLNARPLLILLLRTFFRRFFSLATESFLTFLLLLLAFFPLFLKAFLTSLLLLFTLAGFILFALRFQFGSLVRRFLAFSLFSFAQFFRPLFSLLPFLFLFFKPLRLFSLLPFLLLFFKPLRLFSLLPFLQLLFLLKTLCLFFGFFTFRNSWILFRFNYRFGNNGRRRVWLGG